MENRGTWFRRRRYLINRRLQSGFVIGFSSAMLLGLLANLTVAYFLIDRELDVELYKIHIKIRTTAEIAAPVLMKLGAATIPSIVIISAVIGYLLTQRIELPLQQFREALRRRSAGDFTDGLSEDIPGELPEVFNRMSGSLGDVFGSIKKSSRSLEAGLAELRKAEASKADLRGALKSVREAREAISRKTSTLKV